MDIDGVLLLLAAALTTGLITWQVVEFLFPWLKYDLKYLKILLVTRRMIANGAKRTPIYTMLDKLIDQAKMNPTKPYVYFEDEVWTYQRMNEYASMVARTMRNAGIRTADTVAILMNSRPEFIGIWFGIGKTGATSAFINYNIRGKSLLHCLKVSECKALVVGSDNELLKAVSDIKQDLEKNQIKIYVLGVADEDIPFQHENLGDLIEKQPKDEASLDWRSDLTMKSHFCYVYTSGTTGLPKAAVVRHDRAFLVSQMLGCGCGRQDDIVYAPLPLYHAASGMIGVLGSLHLGCSIVVKKKFSASHFWKDCRKYNATFVQYIGETMRYVCDQPPHPEDKNHRVRVAMGNGLRPQVWKKFLDRFGSDIKIMELYAATEGNAGFLNLDNHLGSVGMMSPLMKATGLLKLIRYDQEKEEIYKDENGRCVEVPYGTPGLFICKITEATAFHGYLGNKKQTEKKIIRNAFKDGDVYFNSGDLLRRDPDYHMYFVDRIGDTFRWKGENVSTNEVADVMHEAVGIKEANVYGVEVPGNEGRAGMVVVLLEEGYNFDPKALYQHASDTLASYACPLFLRIKTELELTGTFKQKKVTLVQEGFNPENMQGDPLYFMDHKNKCYTQLTQELYDKIIKNAIRI